MSFIEAHIYAIGLGAIAVMVCRIKINNFWDEFVADGMEDDE